MPNNWGRPRSCCLPCRPPHMLVCKSRLNLCARLCLHLHGCKSKGRLCNVCWLYDRSGTEFKESLKETLAQFSSWSALPLPLYRSSLSSSIRLPLQFSSLQAHICSSAELCWRERKGEKKRGSGSRLAHDRQDVARGRVKEGRKAFKSVHSGLLLLFLLCEKTSSGYIRIVWFVWAFLQRHIPLRACKYLPTSCLMHCHCLQEPFEEIQHKAKQQRRARLQVSHRWVWCTTLQNKQNYI